MQLVLLLGELIPTPASPLLMSALRGVEVTQTDTGPSGFRLTFATEVDQFGPFLVSLDPMLRPFVRVFVGVVVDGIPIGLIDGFITRQDHQPSNDRESTFVVTGQDVGVRLDLVTVSQEYPAMCDDEVVALLLEEGQLLGMEPVIVPAPVVVPIDHVPQQSETTRKMLARLADQNGYVFFIRAGIAPMLNIAYWGPPPRFEPPSAVLDVAVGPTSTVDAVQAAYDALAPVAYYGFVLDTEVTPALPVPILTTISTELPPLALVPALTPAGVLTLQNTVELWTSDDLDPIVANFQAQAATNASARNAVTLSCDVSVVRLGQVVIGPSVVGLRGAGPAFDGLYYLSKVTHTIGLTTGEGWDYTEHLEMSREGTVSTTPILQAVPALLAEVL